MHQAASYVVDYGVTLDAVGSECGDDYYVNPQRTLAAFWSALWIEFWSHFWSDCGMDSGLPQVNSVLGPETTLKAI